MKIFFILMVCSFTINCWAQTQQGEVKTRGRMENGVLKPGKGLPDATIYVTGRQAVKSQGASGKFTIPMMGQKFRIEKVQKQGYELVDYSVCKEYIFSANTLCLVMDTPEQQQADLLAKERNLRRNLQRKLQQREDEVEALNVSLAEKNRLLQEIEKEREENEKIIKDLAKYYATLDYDQLDEFQQQVNDYLENGELERADSLLRSRGDMTSRIVAIRAEQAAEAKEEADLSQRQKDLEASKAGTQKHLEDIASDCYSFYQRFMQSHQRDSAAYYLELRASLDTTNVEWNNDAGFYIRDYLADYPKALGYYQRMLRQSLQQYGQQDIRTALAYSSIGNVYLDFEDYIQALKFHVKAMVIREDVLGAEHPDMARSYNNIGNVLKGLGEYSKALEYYSRALAVYEKQLAPEQYGLAVIYNNIGIVYLDLGDYPQALEYYSKALAIDMNLHGIEHRDVAISYCNIGNVYLMQCDYLKAMEFLTKAIAIQKKVLGTEHPDLAASYSNLGRVYYYQSDYPKALECYTKSLAIYKKVFGPEHQFTEQTKEGILFIKKEIEENNTK